MKARHLPESVDKRQLRWWMVVCCLLAVAVFSLFVQFHQGQVHARAARQIQDHAGVIATSLWTFESASPAAYLKLAARTGDFARMTVYDNNRRKFVEVAGPAPSATDMMLTDIGLIFLEDLRADVVFADQVIGSVEAVWRCKTIYTYLYAAVCVVLALLGVCLYISLLESNRNLDARVHARTRELERLRRYLANIIDSMPSVIVGVDAGGRVTQWNRQAERETGLGADAAVGRPYTEVMPRLSAEISRVETAIRQRRSLRDLKRPSHQDGETRYEDLTVYPLVANGVDGAVIRLDDVTDRVRLEEMMIQSEKMLSVGGLAAGMAHEINNPLAGIMQTANVMADRLTRDLPANLRAAESAGTRMETIRAFMTARGIPRMLDTIIESGRRAADIVDNMLSFARKSDSAFLDHDIATLLDRTVRLAATDYDLKKRHDFKQIHIIRDYAEQLPKVPCEAQKIQQVFLNILRNGAEAMFEAASSDGSRRPAPQFILRLRSERRMLCIEIEDNGPGMTESTRRRLFEPFFTTKATGKGTGLGLSVSYFIITENHGGEMSVESTPGIGTRFVMRLPVEREEG